MKIAKILLSTFLLANTLTFAQTSAVSAGGNSTSSSGEKVTLQDAIDFALKNNLSIKQNSLQVEQGLNTLEQSKWAKYPTINGGTNFNLFSGRNINPYTNGIITNTVGSNGFGLNSAVTLFDGYQTRNGIALNQLNLEASRLDLQAMKNQITLNIVVGYLNVLSQQDILAVAQRQMEVTQTQLERTQKLVNAGSLPETNLYDIKAQLANDEVSVVNAENAIISAKLTLKQLMNAGADRDIEVVRVEVPNPNIQPYPSSPAQVYEIAQSFLADVQAADMRVKASSKSVDIAKGLKMPVISASANLNSSYSTAAENVSVTQKIIETEAGYVNVAGTRYPVIAYLPTSSSTSEKINYFRQLGGNSNASLGLSVRIPIFNGYSTKFRLTTAQINQKQSELQAQNVRLRLRQDIDQAYVNLTNSAKRYSALGNQVRALEESFRAAESKFNVGSLNALDYSISKTNLDRARTNQIQAKYDYIFRIKILDYYQNKPLSF
ncbi:Outer membrane efflux protein BepC [Emticicia aquatica]|jgi:outer membrane protein|uniref:Outer membrane efflux protein BepC n=1 Tax=Emticicia aquatica TaxID=1681835 RepID=A0ABN8ETU1_9BACT|nr:TolC family protein [Emticicia aquatica]CAH0996460.1 Outer membrane efflux protein BepC [Emticicia aquatica]